MKFLLMNKKKDIFGDEISSSGRSGSSEDFASLFQQSLSSPQSLRVGDSFEGEILSISGDQVFVATGTPTDGSLPIKEILNEERKPKFRVGEKLRVRVLRIREGEVFLRYEGAQTAASGVDNLEDAYDMELPIEGKVTEEIKGGFRVLLGGAKAFCPVSQIDNKFVTETKVFLNQKFEFLITQYSENGRNIVVSRRKLLEAQKLENEGEFLKTAKPGDIFKGTVQKIEKFGAFVRIENGLEGLVPISELAWGRVQNPSDVVQIGQAIDVLLLKAEEFNDRLRLSFSLKQAGGELDPWLKVTTQFPVGTKIQGVVDKKENFGLFVQLAPGVSGLLPRSKWKDHVDHTVYENKKRGDSIEVIVAQIQFEEKRMSLGLPGQADEEDWRTHSSSQVLSGNQKGLGQMAELFKGLSTPASKK